jgi:hypothetical protein
LQQLLLVRFLGFPVWDTLILPIVELSEMRQLRQIDVVRISPRDGRPGRLPPKQLRARPSTTSGPSLTVPPAGALPDDSNRFRLDATALAEPPLPGVANGSGFLATGWRPGSLTPTRPAGR